MSLWARPSSYIKTIPLSLVPWSPVWPIKLIPPAPMGPVSKGTTHNHQAYVSRMRAMSILLFPTLLSNPSNLLHLLRPIIGWTYLNILERLSHFQLFAYHQNSTNAFPFFWRICGITSSIGSTIQSPLKILCKISMSSISLD